MISSKSLKNLSRNITRRHVAAPFHSAQAVPLNAIRIVPSVLRADSTTPESPVLEVHGYQDNDLFCQVNSREVDILGFFQ